MTQKEYEDMLKNGSSTLRRINHNLTNGSTEPKLSPAKASNGNRQDKASNPKRYIISFTIYRVRKLDPDNIVVKWHVDALRYAGLIYDDTEEAIKLSINQEKVSSYKDQKTIITINQIN